MWFPEWHDMAWLQLRSTPNLVIVLLALSCRAALCVKQTLVTHCPAVWLQMVAFEQMKPTTHSQAEAKEEDELQVAPLHESPKAALQDRTNVVTRQAAAIEGLAAMASAYQLCSLSLSCCGPIARSPAGQQSREAADSAASPRQVHPASLPLWLSHGTQQNHHAALAATGLKRFSKEAWEECISTEAQNQHIFITTPKVVQGFLLTV